MLIEIPEEAVPFLRELAAQAGFGDDIQQYALQRSLGEVLSPERIEAIRQNSRIARLVQEGLESGEGEIVDDFDEIPENLAKAFGIEDETGGE